MESAHNSSDPAPTCQNMASVQISSDPAPECQKIALEHDSLSPGRKCQENVSHRDKTVTTSNELDLLFSLMFDKLLNGSSKVVSKSSAVSAADAPNQRQQPTTPLNTPSTPAPTCLNPSIASSVTSNENINQAEPHAENDKVADDEFINIFSTPRWTKDHPFEQVIGNPSQSVRTRRQLELDAEMCMFALTVSRTEPKNIKEAMADSAWIEWMQEELHQFDRLDVWELVDRPLCTNVINLKWLWKNKRIILSQTSSKGVTMASVQISSDPAPECQAMALEHDSLSPRRKCQEIVSHGDKTVTTSNELDLLFSSMFDELLNGSTKVVSKSSVVSAADAPNQRQQPTTPLNNHTTHAPICQNPSIASSIISYENINQAEPHAENDEVADDEFINIFSIPVQDQGETSSRHVDSSNMHTFY
nr:Gag-Pol polyprotein [Tanacetum cinerariifolium]